MNTASVGGCYGRHRTSFTLSCHVDLHRGPCHIARLRDFVAKYVLSSDSGFTTACPTRDYLLHVPRNYDKQKAWPLVLVLHGAFSTAGTMEAGSGYSALADREGFVVAYPNGIGLFGFLQHWNAGHCCGLAEMDHVDDSEFLRYVIRDVSNELHIDPQRIYVVGHSNGAMLAYRFASENCESIAGVGIVAGSIGSSKGRKGATRRIGPPELPVPLIAIHGREDRSVPFEGGPGLRSGGRRYVSVVESVGLWARYCGCGSVPEVRDDPQGGHASWLGGMMQAAHRAVLHILDDWEHAWPGSQHRDDCRRIIRFGHSRYPKSSGISSATIRRRPPRRRSRFTHNGARVLRNRKNDGHLALTENIPCRDQAARYTWR